MSIEKKRRPSDEDGAARPAKKARTFEEVKEKRREKKEKKKELKREKREKKENGHRGPGEKKEKRQNKYEKEKKMRLEKKEKRAREKALSAKNEGSEQKQQPEKQPEETQPETQPEKMQSEETKPQKTKSAKTKPQKTQTQTERVPAENGHTGPSPSMGAYTQTDALTALPESEIQTFLKTEQVAIFDPLAKKDDAAAKLRPLVSFAHLPVTDLTKQQPFAAYTTPTPIQAASWPFSLAGRDLVGIAETGSGKTMAFALPCVEALRVLPKPAPVAAEKLPNRSRLNNKWDAQGNLAQARAVVVAPTRELAMQTHAALAPLAARVGLTAVCLYGGASKDDQRVLLRQAGGVDVIVATPGRLKDFLNDGAVSLAHVRFAVLDEADRMLDTGFEEDIKAILGACPARGERQTLMFTATWPASVRGLADGFMVDPVKVTVGGQTRAGLLMAEEHESGGENATNDEHGNMHGDRARLRMDAPRGGAVELQANPRIAQTVEVLDGRAKERRLLEIIKKEQRGTAKNDRILVFCLYKKEAVRVENFLQGQGVRVGSIHGNLRQEQRTRSLEAFKTGATPVLVATDVAARGLDIPEVKLVINVTFPLTIEDYVHRIGRTGRAGKEGRALTFFTEQDKAHSGSLINVLKGANQEVPEDLLKFGTTVKKKAHGTYGAFFKDVDMSQKGTKITFD